MTYEVIVVFIVLVGAIALFISERLPSDVIGLLILVALGCTTVLSPQDLLAGFGNQAVVTIAAMAGIGGMKKVIGIRSAVAMVAVRPGIEPTKRPKSAANSITIRT